MNRSEANEKAKQHISNAGFGTGTNITIHALKCMMVDFYLDNQVENLRTADVSERFSPIDKKDPTFEILFRDGDWGAHNTELTDMMREMVIRYNKLVEYLKER